jgi:hypothetical protein
MMMQRDVSKKLELIRRLMSEATPEPGAKQEALRPEVPADLGHRGMDSVTREAYLRRIRFLRDRFGLRWLVDEATRYVTVLDCLEDSELVQLQAVLDRARGCLLDGVALEDVGIVPGSWDCANHVSVDPDPADDVANHVSVDLGPEPDHTPWHRRPEDQF